jgi:hypothetical protein
MATTTYQLPQLHDHAGARWLAYILPTMALVIFGVMILPFIG